MSTIPREGTTLVRRWKSDSGQAVVEFAFVIIPLVVLMLGLIDFARLWMQHQILTDAAREGARMAVIANDQDAATKRSEIYGAIRQTLAGAGISTAGSQFFAGCQEPGGSKATAVEIYECGWGDLRGEPARVTIRAPYRFPILGGFADWAFGGDASITLATSIVMRNE